MIIEQYATVKKYFLLNNVYISKTMANLGSAKLQLLMKRINEAQEYGKLLNAEIEGIKQDIGNMILLSNSAVEDSVPSTSNTKRRIQEIEEDNGPRKYPQIKAEENITTVFACGISTSNTKAGIGVWLADNHSLNVSKLLEKIELKCEEFEACIEALKVIELSGLTKIKLFTHSEYLHSCMTKWINNWKKNNWKNVHGEPVNNKEVIQKLNKMAEKYCIEWVYLPDTYGIKEAEKLARKAIQNC